MSWIKPTKRGGGIGKLYVNGQEYASHRETLEFGESASKAFHENPNADVFAIIPEQRIDFELMDTDVTPAPVYTDPVLNGFTLDPGTAGEMSMLMLDIDSGGRTGSYQCKVVHGPTVVSVGFGPYNRTIPLPDVEALECMVEINYGQEPFTLGPILLEVTK